MKKTTSLAHATVNGAEQDPPLGFPYCDDDTAVTAQQVSLGGGLRGYTVVRTDCTSKEYCGDGHCCPKGTSWSSSQNKCVSHDPCYTAPCVYSPFSSLWWGSDVCVDTSMMRACCYAGSMYGLDDWYDWRVISTYQFFFIACNLRKIRD